jgi:hypothetical protein
LKNVEIRRNLKDITSRYNEFIQQRRNRADMSSISMDSMRESNESARISMNHDPHRANHDESSISSESARLSSISIDSARESNESAVDSDELIDYLLEFPYGMHEILPRFFPFLHRGDGLIEQGRRLAKIRPEVCLRVPRARELMRRIVGEWEQNRLELVELAADLGLIAREKADRAWHPEIMKALLAASFLYDSARMDRAARFLQEPSGPERGAPNATRGHSQDVHPEGMDLPPAGASTAGRSIPEAPVVRIVYEHGQTGICVRFLGARCPYCGGIHEHGGGLDTDPIEKFLGPAQPHCSPSAPAYVLVIRGDPEMVRRPIQKAAEAPSGPDPAAEALIEPLLQALDAGIRTDVALAEHLKAPRHLVQEVLRILAARGQVAAFASDGVCCWARVPRESEDSDSEPDSREVSSIPRESLNFNPESNESLSDSARISTNFDHNRADKNAISTESARNSNDGYREMFVHSNLAARFREVFRERSRRPPADRLVRVPTFERLLERYRELHLRVKEREMSNSDSIPRNSSRDGRAEMKERIMALARMRPITGSMVSNRLGIPHALTMELIGELLREGRLRVENTMLVPARPRS